MITIIIALGPDNCCITDTIAIMVLLGNYKLKIQSQSSVARLRYYNTII